ncbi:MAG: molecular chaperone HtpG [Propionibacteriaceae bacterium]
MTAPAETLQFQSEARQLLQLMIHSIYSNKDTFLRELISNASDALDKLRLEALRAEIPGVDVDDLHVDLEVDAEARTLTVRDNGIGMTRAEVVELIGTIAKSGTAEFLAELRTQDAAASEDLIGQFGIGFYSSFMVADTVTLVTRRAGTDAGVRWESSGESTYTLEPVTDAPVGTAVTLRLKPADADEQLADYTSVPVLTQIVKRYSDFIAWPVRVSDENADGDVEVKTINAGTALWARPTSEVSEEEYAEFYRHIAHDWTDPLQTIRLQAEGTFEYQALLFIPSRAPMDLFVREAKRGVQLYVKRVFIMDDCEELVPDYLRFVKGVVDAADLSLNVSREILQQDRHIQRMRRRLVRKVLSSISDLQTEQPEKYATCWTEFGRVIKEGLLSDPDQRTEILGICSFASTHDPEQPTTLAAYRERMVPGQEHIYYLNGESRTQVENSPHLEALRAKGYEVLILTDPVDEVWVDQVTEFDGTALQSVAKGQVDLQTEEEKTAAAERDADFADVLAWLGTTLDEQVKQVRLSTRLTTSPACVVGDEHDLTPMLEKMYKSMGQELPPTKRILELNPTHPLITGLRDAYARTTTDGSGDTSGDTSGGDRAELVEDAQVIFDLALLAEGGDLADPARFVRLVADRVHRGLSSH